MNRITPQDLKNRLTAEEIVELVDVRNPDLYRHSHIPNAVNVEFNDQFEVISGRILRDKDLPLVVYAAHEQDPVTEQACNKLAELGYGNVQCLIDGLMGWVEAGYEVESGRET